MPSTEQTSATPVNVAATPPASPIPDHVSEFYLTLKGATTDEYADTANRALKGINHYLNKNCEPPMNHLIRITAKRSIDIIPLIWDDEALMQLLGINVVEVRRAKGAIKAAYEAMCGLAGMCSSGKNLGTTIVTAAGMYAATVAINGESHVVEGSIEDYMVTTPSVIFSDPAVLEDEGEMEDEEDR